MKPFISSISEPHFGAALLGLACIVLGGSCAEPSGADALTDSPTEDAEVSVVSIDADATESFDTGQEDVGQNVVPADASSEDAGPDTEADAMTCHTFESSVQPIFNQACVQCHGSGSDNNGLNLTPQDAFNVLMNSVSQYDPALNFVVPGDAEASFLIEKMNPNPSYGLVMPVNGPNSGMPLAMEKRQIVADWIDAGADLAPFGCVTDDGP